MDHGLRVGLPPGVGDKSLLEGRVPHVGDVQCVAELRSECVADAAGGIRPWANVGVAKGSDEAVAELAASVGDEASRWRPCGRSSSEQWVAVARFRLLAWPAGFDM